MPIAHTIDQLAPFTGGILIPTMGALHPGHLLIVEAARKYADKHSGLPVVVSIFVNPTQFNEQIDFDTYPKRLEQDARGCTDAGATCIFAPAVETMYPEHNPVPIPPLPAVVDGPRLEDLYRPGHFPGVCQVCNRLFELCKPRATIFGEKDWQQLTAIRAMCAQLDLPIDVLGHPTVREADGLAMSSRNLNLTPEQRGQAVGIARGLVEAGKHTDPAVAEQAGLQAAEACGVRMEYLSVRDAETLLAPTPGKPARVLAAGRLGDVRLIDNAPWPAFSLRDDSPPLE
jgi:pantoate--beta-alanine ligase